MRLEVAKIAYHYHTQRKVFSDVSFTVDQGEIFSILGSNGAGKSTLLNCLANLCTPVEGEVYLDGIPMHKLELRQIARKIGYVPQIHIPAYGYAVRDFVVMGRAPHIGRFSIPGKIDYQMADEAIEKLGITHLADRSYTELSGGERQQAMIARVIVQEPELILLDEPTSHLDYGNQLRTLKLINTLAAQGYGVIMTTHTPDHAILLGGKTGLLDSDGHMCSGPSLEIISEHNLRQIYRSDIRLVYIGSLGRKACVAANL